MELCRKNHDEVCFEGYSCPACEAIWSMEKEKDKEIEKLNEEKSELETRLDDAVAELNDLKSGK